MKFVVSSATLYSHLQAIGRVINSKSTLPILDCFLFNIEGNKLAITASDNETTLDTSMELVESDGNFQFAISSKTLLDAIKELPEQPITFDINTQSMEIAIQYMNGKYAMIGQSADEYPMGNNTADSCRCTYNTGPECRFVISGQIAYQHCQIRRFQITQETYKEKQHQ